MLRSQCRAKLFSTYLIDNFNREHFDSNSGTWSTLGWND